MSIFVGHQGSIPVSVCFLPSLLPIVFFLQKWFILEQEKKKLLVGLLVYSLYSTFFLHPRPIYWDLTLQKFLLQLRNIVYDTTRDMLGLMVMQEIPLYWSGMTKE